MDPRKWGLEWVNSKEYLMILKQASGMLVFELRKHHVNG